MIDELKALKAENAVLRSKLKGESEALTTLLREYDENTKKHKESLAAARRECEDWRAVEAECGAVDCHCGCHVYAKEAALAAPADGEEGKR